MRLLDHNGSSRIRPHTHKRAPIPAHRPPSTPPPHRAHACAVDEAARCFSCRGWRLVLRWLRRLRRVHRRRLSPPSSAAVSTAAWVDPPPPASVVAAALPSDHGWHRQQQRRDQALVATTAVQQPSPRGASSASCTRPRASASGRCAYCLWGTTPATWYVVKVDR